jgi:hypothetical protein
MSRHQVVGAPAEADGGGGCGGELATEASEPSCATHCMNAKSLGSACGGGEREGEMKFGFVCGLAGRELFKGAMDGYVAATSALVCLVSLSASGHPYPFRSGAAFLSLARR